MSTVLDSSTRHGKAANPAGSGSKLAHGAFWIMARRVTLVAAAVDLSFLVLFLALNSPVLAWLNLASIAMYAAAYGLLTRRLNLAALLLIWLEVLGHAAIGSILVGWESGFHYYLLMFIPAIMVSARVRTTVVLGSILLVFYLGLHAVSRATGALTPLGSEGLMLVHGFNVSIVFAMAAYTARFYYNTVRRAEKKLLELATQDSLTGLSNRRNLMTLARHEMARARRAGEPIALIVVDIDHFKAINDRHGHETGDQVICHAANTLLNLCRAQDIVSRWGGEEFLLLLPSTPVDAAAALAERIRTTVAGTGAEHAGMRIAYTVSIGAAVLNPDETLIGAIARADRALYQSKADGRNRITVAA